MKEEITNYPSKDKPWLKYYDYDTEKLEIPNMSIYQMASLYNKDRLDNIALDIRTGKNNFKKGVTITYREYLKKMREFAKSLSLLGVKENEIISLVLPNIIESRVSIYGSNILGATPYAINPLLAPEKFNTIIEENNIQNIFMFSMFYEKYKNVLNIRKYKNVIFLDGMETMPTFLKTYLRFKNNIKVPIGDNFISYEEFIREGKKTKKEITPFYEEDHTAIIVGTSGTTGVPKGVCLTDKNLNAAATSHISTGLFEENDVFLDVLLQSIAYGVSAMHYTTCGGLKSILIPELVSDKMAYLLKTTNPDHFLGGPIHCLNIAKSEEFKSGELKPIKNYVSGGATLKKELEKKLNKVSEDFKENGTRSDLFVRQGLGSTENTGGGLYQMPGSYKFGSVGIPLPLNTIGVFTPRTDIELPYNTMGELCITGPCVMKEYLNNVEETNKVLKRHSDGKVWLHMGDIGYIDKDGCFFHKHRLSDIFMRRGFNVHPGKITELLNTISEIKAVGVIVVEHPIEEMVPIACISLYNEFDNDKVKEKIENICKNNLDDMAIPYEYVYMEELPLNAGGKVNLPVLKRMYEERNSLKLKKVKDKGEKYERIFSRI